MSNMSRNVPIGVALGALPGLALLGAGLRWVSGEARLSVAVIGIALAAVGALAGGALAAGPRLGSARVAAWAGIGAIAALAASRALPGRGAITLAAVVAGAGAGGLVGAWAGRRRPPAARRLGGPAR